MEDSVDAVRGGDYWNQLECAGADGGGAYPAPLPPYGCW